MVNADLGTRIKCNPAIKTAEDRTRARAPAVIQKIFIDRLAQTVRDLLVFARPKRKKPVPTDIHAILERVLEMIRRDPESRDS